MQLRINGQDESHPDGLTLAELIEQRGLDPQRVAVERNRQLVPRSRHAQTPLAEGDVLEIVTLAGGG